MGDLPPLEGEGLKRLWQWLGWLWASALVGRLAWRAHTLRKDRRLFWSWDLLYEVPIALLCGTAGGGLALYFELGTLPSLALASVLSYLGPGAIEAYVARFANRLGKGPKE